MHIMVDLETMATTCDAAILSIGAVKFDLTSDKIDEQGFYGSITLESNMDWGRRFDPDTIRWWMTETSEDARKVFSEPGKQGLCETLESFAEWFGAADQCIWSNGANFDEPILAHAFSHCRLPIPWQFWNVKCMRTYKNLPGAKDVKVDRAGTHHNALMDALYQAQLVQKIHAKLFPLPTKLGARK